MSLLRPLRDKRDLSLLELSELTGLSKSYLNDLERGKRKGSIETLQMLADFYNYDFKALCQAQSTRKEGV